MVLAALFDEVYTTILLVLPIVPATLSVLLLQVYGKPDMASAFVDVEEVTVHLPQTETRSPMRKYLPDADDIPVPEGVHVPDDLINELFVHGV